MLLGGLFELVSCPHYLAEVVIYLGLVVASQGQLLPLLMLIWVVSAAAGCLGTARGPGL
jgi:3-oxo-5-alpha-steroid 4-dehydrogenase 3